MEIGDWEIERLNEKPVSEPSIELGALAQPIGDGQPQAAGRRPLVTRYGTFTIADGLMLLITLPAAVLRFGELARLPLSAAEATAALANWRFWSATPLDLPVGSPAYFAFSHLVMALGGSGDTAARLVPAIFGLLTVLLPWGWRGQLRPAAWLTAALFLAVSPLLVAVSRVAGGDAIALFALMLLVVSGQWLMIGRSAGQLDDNFGVIARRSSLVSGAALGLGLASSPLFYTGLAALAGTQMLTAGRRSATGDDRRQPDDHLSLNRTYWRRAMLAAGATFVIISTSFLLYPAGIGAALRLFPAWLGQFGLPAGGDGLSPVLALLRYEPALLVLGGAAVVWAWVTGNRFGRALATWVGLTLLLVILQPGIMVNAAAVLLPGYLLVGLLGAAVVAQPDARGRAGGRVAGFTAAALIGLGALLLAAGGRFSRLNLLTGENATLLALAAAAFVLAGLAVVLAMAWESPAARRGAFVGAAALLLFWQWGAAWQLSRLGANDPRERWVVAGTDDDTVVMADLLARVSRQTANSDRDLDVFSLVDSPVLRWYLRDLVGYRSGAALPVNAQPDVVIAPAEVEPALYADYFGADFGLEQRQVAGATRGSVAETLKWWLFRESAAPVETQRVVVWIRSDLAAPE